MTAAETIQALAEYARRVLAAAEADRSRPGAAKLADVKRAAREVMTRAAPVAVGVVGGFNAGKSLLLGGLVGWADALPVSEVPTTGNLTELALLPHDGDGPTELGMAEVEFLDRATAVECLRDCLAEIAGPEGKKKLAAAEWSACQDLAANADFGPVEKWAKKLARGNAAATNPVLYAQLCELAWFVRCAGSPGGSELLGAPGTGGRRWTVPAEIARSALELPRTEVPGPDEPVPRALAGSAPDEIGAEFVRAAFPLIARVRLEVKVPPGVWDFGAAKGATFVLLDFPGLGAADSRLRDEVLCRRALRDVQTILVVLDGQRPGEGSGQELVSMLRAHHQKAGVSEAAFNDRILAAVNRFDLLPLEEGRSRFRDWTGWDTATRSLGTPTAAPPTDAEIRTQLPALGKALKNATDLVDKKAGPGRVVLTSGWWGLLALERTIRPGRPVGSPKFEARLAETEWPAPLADQWNRLGARLSGADAASPLVGWLTEVSGDGGRGALQRLLGDHVARHGLAQLAADVREAYHRLRAAVAQLPPPTSPVPPGRLTTPELRRRLLELLRELNDFSGESAVVLTVERGGRRLPLWDLVGGEVRRRLRNEQAWRDLFSAVGEDGRIRLQSTPGGFGMEAETEEVSSSAALLSPFGDAVADAGRQIHALLGEAIGGEFKRLATRLRPVAEELAVVLEPATAERVQKFAGGLSKSDQSRARNQWLVLQQVLAADTPAVRERYEAERQKLSATAPELTGEDCFPLPGAGPGEEPLLFPWHRLRQTQGQASGPHQAFLVRLRDHVTSGARHHAAALVSRLSEDALDTFRKLFRVWRDQLEAMLRNTPMLDCLSDQAAVPAAAGWRVADEPAPTLPAPRA